MYYIKLGYAKFGVFNLFFQKLSKKNLFFGGGGGGGGERGSQLDLSLVKEELMVQFIC